MKNPKVSVVIPSYNHEMFIIKSVQSVLDQTFQDFEIIVSDDGSSDNSLEKIKSINDKRIKLIFSKKNKGACVAVNKALKHVRGTYVALLNSDDIFFKHKLEKQVSYLDSHPSITAVFSTTKFIDEKGDSAEKIGFQNINKTRYLHLNDFFYHGNTLCHPSVMIRKKNYGPFDPRLAQMPDFDMWVRLLMKKEIYIDPEPLVQFRIRNNHKNTSSETPMNSTRTFNEFKYILNHYLNITSLKEFLEIFPEAKLKFKILKSEFIPFYLAFLSFGCIFSSHHQFGLDILFKLLQDESQAKKIYNTFGFSYIDFIRLMGKYDIFHVATKKNRQDQIDKKTYEKIINSKFYKLWQFSCSLKKNVLTKMQKKSSF